MKKLIAISFVLTLLFFSSSSAQMFGKNKIQYDEFNWSFIQTPHFDVYFYNGGENLAEFAAQVAEEAHDDITEVLNWRMRRRYSLIIYNSHSDFQQTNVTLDYLTEGTQGFTELFKNRAVVAFDGSYRNFEHVVRHELVHVVVNDMIYSGNIQSVLSGSITLNIPLWMHEGLAEYLSIGWDTNADMIVRDIATYDRLPTAEDLQYYLAYKGGQSIYKFISERYGVEKIGDIWSQMKGRGSVERGLKSSLGMDMKELIDKWHKWLKKEYWPDVQDRDYMEDIAKRLTDHKKLKNYFNISPAISPNGDLVAIMSDRDGYADIFLISYTDGKVVKKLLKGQRTPDLEELKWLNPRLSWSPDGEKIVLAAKSGDKDAIIIVDVKTGKRKSIKIENVEEIFTVSWSRDGDKLAFIGLKDDRTDLYVYHIKNKQLLRLTNDQFSDFEPAWSPDGKRIVFASQRGNSENDHRFLEANPDTFEALDMKSFNFHQTDLFIYDLETGFIERLTDTPWDENYPVWSNSKDAIIYTSDASGISNLYVMDLKSKEGVPITNVLTGIFQPSISKDESKLVFAGYSDNGWDVYCLSNPFDLINQPKELKPTNFAKAEEERQQHPEKFTRFKSTPISKSGSSFTHKKEETDSYTHYIFAPGYEKMPGVKRGDDSTATLDSTKYQTEEGKYIVNQYKTKFTLDYISSQLGYSQFWGFQGSIVFALSDVLGNHRFILATEQYIDLQNSDYLIYYEYLPKKINYSFYIFHTANFYAVNPIVVTRFRNYGGNVSICRPFSKFTRVELGVMPYNVEQSYVNVYTGEGLYRKAINTIIPWFSWVYDNALWSYFHPVDGWRSRLNVFISPQYKSTSLDFRTCQIDIRRYFKIDMNYSFGLRLSTGFSDGRNPQKFFLGGEENWINRRYKRYPDYDNLAELYFSDFITPLRGARYYEAGGNRYFLLNFEFRYPFIKYLKLGWPLSMTMGGIHGVTFVDLGSAWYDNKFRPFGWNEVYGLYFEDLIGSFGLGTRIFLGYFLLKIDVAWRFDLNKIYKPVYLFSLGLDF